MGYATEFIGEVKETIDDRLEDDEDRPRIEVFPDEFDLWVAAHEDHVRAIICGTPEFAASPFCGPGLH